MSPVLESLAADALEFLPKLVQALVILVLSIWLAGLAGRALGRTLRASRLDNEIALLVARVTRIGMLSVGLVVALEQVDFDLSGFVAGLGIVGFTIGFALQDVSKNLVAGLLLLLQQPFDIGDAIEVSGYAGVVTGINLRATSIRTFDGVEVLIPNTDVYAKVVRVFGLAHFRRLELTVQAASDDAAAVKRASLTGLAAVSGAIQDRPGPKAMILSIDRTGAKVLLWFWTDLASNAAVDVGDAAVRAVRDALAAEGLEPTSVSLAAPHPDVMGGVKLRPKRPVSPEI